MRVLLIDVNCKNSSTGKIVYDLYTMLRQNGDEAAVCYGRGEELREENIYKFGLDWETMLHALLTRITGWTGCFSFFSTRRLLRFVEEFRPDVVHIHELHAYFVNLRPVVEYLRKNRIKTIWTFHCEFMYTGKCGHAYECEGWLHECGHCPHLRDYPKAFFADRTAAMLAEKKKLFQGWNELTIAAPSEWLADRVRRSFLGDKRIVVVHNGIDTDIFHPRDTAALRRELGLGEERVILAVAPDILSDAKGGRQVLKLAERMAGEKVRFLLVGADGTIPTVPDNVRVFARTRDQVRLAEFYSLADVFVICSRRENFPTTCVEALCCGAPVAGFAEGGTAETAPAPYGRFVTYGALDALEAAVRTLSAEASLEKRKNCAQWAMEEYSRRTMFRVCRALYEGR